MSCTTILVGKKASLAGGNIIARSDDSGSKGFTPKKLSVIDPKTISRQYESKVSHCLVALPDNPQSYVCVPSASDHKGMWASCGVNASNTAMSASETITSNPRVYGADPLVYYHASSNERGGIGEEDLVTLVLPYIKSAREGVRRTGDLLEQYGTYEKNGIAFSDEKEIWWMETIGGHHWIARKLPDDCIAVIVNQLGMDAFDMRDAMSEQQSHMCSSGMGQWILDNHLYAFSNTQDHRFIKDSSKEGRGQNKGKERRDWNAGLDVGYTLIGDGKDHFVFSPREYFGSDTDSDALYNTPRLWDIQRRLRKCLDPSSPDLYQGPSAIYHPHSIDLPWCFRPEKKMAPEDIQQAMASHFQGTDWDPYGRYSKEKKKYRPAGINRCNFVGMVEHRPKLETLLWLSFGCSIFTPSIPLFARMTKAPAYLSSTTLKPDLSSAYWASRFLAAMADASWGSCIHAVRNYQQLVANQTRQKLRQADIRLQSADNEALPKEIMDEANHEIAQCLAYHTDRILDEVLRLRSFDMNNAYGLSDAW